ncbi:hypothetical protein HYT74_00080 [Candidatus Daviesbacteria bacterium]|nr:hypothetical protein [Candidatus Daviesbacteria bacterium]
MTLIIGIVAENGIVVASDGVATLGNLGQFTARQQTKKLSIVQSKAIVGVSGPVGLGQMLTGELDRLLKDPATFTDKQPDQVMSLISQRFRTILFPELQAAQVTFQLIGGTARDSAISFSIVALPVNNNPYLFQFNQQGSPEQANDGLPFVAIGSGQQIADPFLAFIRRNFWKDRLPTIGEAEFAAMWTLEQAIQTNPGGIGDPKQMMVLRKAEDHWIAEELEPEQLEEHQESVKNMEDYIANYDKTTEEEDDEALPEIPTPDK